MYDDVMTRNDDGELAVRTVSATEGTNPSSYDDVFTRDSNGKLALRVVGAGGGDSHNKGYFATQAALEEAYPTGEAGDYAIVGSTDTVWLWDDDNSEWVDSDQKGQVTSVNNQTGAVTIGADDILPSQTGYSGRVLGTDGFVAGWIAPEIVQRSTMPQASEDELGNIYQFTGTTDANYTNGYFYKCVSDGQQPATYSWSQVSVQPAPVIPDPLPSQTGNSGKFLTTDGTDASWGDALVNTATGTDSLTILGIAGTNQDSINIGTGSSAARGSIAIGNSASSQKRGIAIGLNSIATGTTVTACPIVIGYKATASADFAIQLGSVGSNGATNSDANTFKVANANGNYEIMSADGTIPADRLTHAINKYSSMPTAASTNEGWIVQYTGTTDATYTHGYIYECVSDGGNPATYSWSAVQVQAGGGGSLPTQTGNAGKFLYTDGTDASWSDKPLVNKATGNNSLSILGNTVSSLWGVAVGAGASVTGNFATAIGGYLTESSGGVALGYNTHSSGSGVAIGGENTRAEGTNRIAIGYRMQSNADNAIQIGGNGNTQTNSDANTFKVANANGNYEIMSADGTVPADRLAKAINKYSTMPTAASTNEGWIVQYTGATDSTYTHGYIYECVSDGGNPATYSWTAVQVQAGGGGSLPSQTGNSGKFLTTDGTDASWSDKPLVNTATGTSSLTLIGMPTSSNFATNIGYNTSVGNAHGLAIGSNASSQGTGSIAIGRSASQTSGAGNNQIAIGYDAHTAGGVNSVQIGSGTNSSANTVCFGNANGNFTIMDANGNLPTDRLASTTGLTDGNYRLRLVMASGVPTLTWVAE